MLSYPFSILYYEIEKRKTKGRYIHGPTDFTDHHNDLFFSELDQCVTRSIELFPSDRFCFISP